MAGLVENKANSARPAKLKLATSWGWAELGKNKLSQVGGRDCKRKPTQPSLAYLGLQLSFATSWYFAENSRNKLSQGGRVAGWVAGWVGWRK